MPNYFYTAKSMDGKTKTGELPAKDLHELSALVKEEGMVLVKAISEEEKNKRKTSYALPFLSGVSATEKIMMTKNLQVMASTGLSVVKSFEVLQEQTKSPVLKVALFSIREKVNKGESFSSALSHYPDIFSDFFVSMVKVGEESGTMEDVLKILASQMEKEHKLKSKIQGAMIYPGIIMVVMFLVGIIIATVVLPSLNSFFASMGSNIPFYTKMVIKAGQLSTKYWPVLILFPFVVIGAIWASLKTQSGKLIKDTLFLQAPLIKELSKKNNCAVMIRSLSSLVSSGVPLLRSLEITSGTVGNHYFKKALMESLEKIKKGERLSKALSPHKNLFPFGVIEMMEVGEETGKTTTILKELADFYEEEAIAATEKISAAVEPMLIVVLGVAVAFFAFSIIQPMYSSLGAIY